MSADGLGLLSGVLDAAALALILALAVGALWLAPPSSPRDTKARYRWLLAALLCAGAGSCFDLLARSATLADLPPMEALGVVPRVLTETDFGRLWLWRAGAWFVVLAAGLWIVRSGWAVRPSVVVGFVTLMSALWLSATGHAGEQGVLSLPNFMNWLHLVGMALWGGPVILYAFLVLPGLRAAAIPADIAAVSQRLSSIATLALALVLVSGVYNSWKQLGALEPLWTTDYGRILLVKLALVLAMLGIGAYNRVRLVPQVLAWSCAGVSAAGVNPAQRFLLVLRVDSLVFVVVLVIAAWLSMQPPPAHGESMDAVAPAPLILGGL